MKLLLLTLTALLLVSAVQAQIGFRAGANYELYFPRENVADKPVRLDGYWGYQASIFYEQKLSSRWSLVPEVQFSRQQVGVEVARFNPAELYFATYRLRMSYLTIPLLLRARFGRFYLEAGPQVGYLLAAHEKGTETTVPAYSSYRGPDNDQEFDRSATGYHRRVDAGGCAGFGVTLPSGFGVGIRSYISPFATAKDGHRGVRNQIAQASVSYQFGRE